MSQDTLKILVVGDVKGNYGKLFNRVKSINDKNGPFDMLLCVGEFFGSSEDDWEPYKSGQKTFPVPTYILGPCKSETQIFYPDLKGCEMAPNITYLGDRGIYTGSNGLKIAYLSGKEGHKSDVTTFSHDAIKAIEIPAMNEPNFKGIDILLTSQWPKDVCKFSTPPVGIDAETSGSSLVSALAKTLKPRYHFAGMGGVFFQRRAYRNHRVLQESACHVSWFVGMAEVGNPAKEQKWVYAFNITPLKKEDPIKLCLQPTGVTDCPYSHSVASNEEVRQEALQNQFFYDTKAQNRQDNPRKRKHQNQDQAPRPPPKPMGPCWFCLSSPEVEKHLVISVGDQCYLALAKGHLTPDHVLILPIGHYQKTVGLPKEVLDEINKFKAALRECFKKQNQGVVFFERNYKSPHLQIQAIPVPLSLVRRLGDNLTFEEVFIDGSRAVNVNLKELPKDSDVQEVVKPNAPYFYMELPQGQQLLSYIERGVQFPLEFGREIMACSKVLNLPDRIHWRDCVVSKAEEAKLVADFREKFKPFELTDD